MASCTGSTTASATPECHPPNMAMQLSASAMRRALSTPRGGWPPSSYVTKLSGLPSTPPAALISAIATSAPLRIDSAAHAVGPVIGSDAPIQGSDECAERERVPPETRAAASRPRTVLEVIALNLLIRSRFRNDSCGHELHLRQTEVRTILLSVLH